MTLRLNGSTSGYVEIDAPAAAGNNTLRFPTGNGSSGQLLTTDGAGNLSWANKLTEMTSVATTSGTSFDFTGIPDWATRITVVGTGVSTSGPSLVMVQLGTSAGIVTSGYSSGTSGSGLPTNGIPVDSSTNGAAIRVFQLPLLLVTGNLWAGVSYCQRQDTAANSLAGGSITLSGTLDRIRLTTANGTDTFDAGTVNVIYEG